MKDDSPVRALDVWQALFQGSSAGIELPTDHPRAGRDAGGVAEFECDVEPALATGLAELARRHGTGIRTVLLAAWIAWLRRMSGQGEVLVGMVDDASEDRLAIEVDIEDGWKLHELLACVDGKIEQAAGTGGLASATSAQLSQLVHGDAPEPLFRATFDWLRTAAVAPVVPAVPPDVAISFDAAGDGFTGRIRFADALFAPATMQRHAGHWRTLLQGLAAHGDDTIDALPLLSATERTAILDGWNDNVEEFPDDRCIHELIEDQVRRTPDARALVQDGRVLTYAELNARANQLAHHLRALGVRPDDRVAICAERGFPMIIGLLATLKAGGAYVPLDPAYPPERIDYMIQDSAPAAVLAQGALVDLFAGAGTMPVLDMTAGSLPWSQQSTDDPSCGDAGLQSRHLAYVIYTSGSTGKPKGVAVEHRGLCNLVASTASDWGIDASSRMLQFASFSFDASVWETMEALCKGAELHLPPVGTIVAGEALVRAVEGQGLTHVILPPAVLATIPAETSLDSIHTLLVGGDVLTEAVARRWRSGHRLINGYGPSEITVCATMHECSERDRGNPPIGRPIGNTRVYILDARRQPVPIGVAGELYIGGAGVARGYLNRPELTAERFLRDPFVADPQARMYKSGDLGRFRADGTIEFIGRNDFQVKVRGFRIELEEIEARLLEHGDVLETAVVVREDRPGDKRVVAYCVVAPDAEGNKAAANMQGTLPTQLRHYLAALMPGYMVPSAFVCMDALPLSPNGKLDRKALPAPDRARPDLAIAYEPATDTTEQAICDAFAELLELERVGRHDNFFELGGNSLLAARLLEILKHDPATRGASIPVTTVFQNPAPAALATAIAATASGRAPRIDATRMAQRSRPNAGQGANRDDDPIAIISMAGRFPGAGDIEAFWDNLRAGRDSITRFRLEDLDPSVTAAERADPAYVPARGVIEDVEQFDAAFFGISPREAELMDPQQRIFLELCWECLERGGHVPDDSAVPVGIFAGMNNGTYLQRHVSAHPELAAKVGAVQVVVGNEKDYIATRVAHKLNLTGPAISTHTACSTSLVAICQAVDSLRAGHCDMALAGAASVVCPPRSGYIYQEGAMLSPDGHTRTFDASAQGTVFSDGAAVVLLKRLSDALADGDQVHALIRGGAINNDGGQKASFTAPSVDGQAAVIAMAHRNAGVEPRSISYVEAHGTATPVGDPIEIEGLTKAFRLGTGDVGFCRVGSVKSNVGHLVAAAGAAGVIKTALSLREKVLPATVHFTSPNPGIALDGSPFVVNDALQDWTSEGAPRRAGVSSFGVGGTNAHVVMEEAPALPDSDVSDEVQLLVLSARTPHALAQAAVRLADHLERDPSLNFADVAWTLAAGRKAFAHRVAIASGTAVDAAEQLRSLETTASIARSKPARASDVVFMFPGQGSQYAGMGRELHASEPAFREAFDACAEALDGEPGFERGPTPGQALRDIVFGDDADALLPTSVMQPAIFAIEYATAKLWMSRGVQPAAMIGHSIGEFVAATLAGVFALDDAVRLVARRGRLMQAHPAGGMLSVRLPLDALMERLPDDLSLAAENGPGACVVSGTHEAIARFQAELEAGEVACRALRTSHAFHSAMMQPVVPLFRAEVERIVRNAPSLPIVSTATGDWLDADSAVSPDYWASHLREPVRFAAALARVIDAPARVLLEVGPRTTLAGLAKQRISGSKSHVAAVASLSDAACNEATAFRLAAGQLWCRGVLAGIDLFDRRAVRRRVCLPTYPFERKRYWVEAAIADQAVAPPSSSVLSSPVPVPVVISIPEPENTMPSIAPMSVAALPVASTPAPSAPDRRPRLLGELKEVFEDVAGFDLADADEDANFMELGLDSLNLTQVALQLQRTFQVKITFRQLMSDYSSLRRLVAWLDEQLPAETVAPVVAQEIPAPMANAAPSNALPTPFAGMALSSLTPAGAAPMQAPIGNESPNQQLLQQVIQQQMQVMSQQLAMLAGAAQAPVASVAVPAQPVSVPVPAPPPAPVAVVPLATAPATAEDDGAPQARYDVQKSFGAIARIHTGKAELDPRQQDKLHAFLDRYVARTPKSKAYTQEHRPHMADPRVVSGFRPMYKEIVYQTVMARSKGSRLWDIDGNEYVDANNGFGMSMFGWQPDFVVEAVRELLDQGYEIGPQHPLSGEVTKLICELTGHDRAALCNTGSEAVLGALRVARTVTGRSLIAVFNGSYHGINDEVVIRGNRKHQAMPGAPGILRNSCENMLVLDYGTPEALQLIREHAHELAAVIVEPVQSRRADFQPVEFLREVREITKQSGTLFVFDEVITGFRSHAGGTQALFGIKADLATYGKVIGGGYPLGVIAGKREYMDALDGGHWEYGDDSIPTVGVTYFAGTFVRHPLALAACHAVLTHLKQAGPQLQEKLNARATQFADELNAFCREVGAPIEIKQFSSMWRTSWLEDHPLQDLLYAMMRSRGVHILDNFPCFFTTAHSEADIQAITQAYKDSVMELQEAGFLPRSSITPHTVMDPQRPPVANARLGREPDGRPAWFVPDAERPGKYLKVAG